MRLLELQIENFGVHRDCALELHPHFQPIFGENESGKSTLLELVRQLLYNFAHVNAYAFEDRSGGMAASVLAELDDGRRLRFRRRKGKGNTVTGNFLDTNQTVDQSTLEQLLAGTTSEMYKHLFGFSLDELSAGQEGLTRANLQQAIFGSGLGSLERLTQLQKKLREERERLFLHHRTARKPEINALLRRIGELTRELNSSCVRPHEYRQKCQVRDELAAETQRLGGQRSELRRRQSKLQRLLKALPQWCRLRDVQRQLAELPVPEGLPVDLAERHQQLSQRRSELSEQCENTAAEIRRLEVEIQTLIPAAPWLECEGELRRLQQQLGHIESMQQELPELTQRADQQRAHLAGLLEHLDPEWDQAAVQQFHTCLADRAELDGLSELFEHQQRQHQKLAEQLRHVEEELEYHSAQLRGLGETQDVGPLQRMLNEQASFQANLKTCEEIDEQRMRLEQRMVSIRQSLQGALQQGVSELEKLPVPMIETVERFRQRFDVLRDKRRGCEQALDAAEAALQEKIQELENVGAEMSAPDRDALKRQRRRRDEGWEIVRRIHILGQDATSEAQNWLTESEGSLADAFEREMRKADDMADQRQEQASLVARQEQLEREVQLQRSRVVSERKKHDNCVTECKRLEEEWRSIWTPSRITPLSPEEMRHWLTMFQEYVSVHDDETVLARRRRDLQDKCDDFAEEVEELLGDVPGDVHERLRVASERVHDARQADAARQSCHEHVTRLSQQRGSFCRELEQLDQQQAAWHDAWKQWLGKIGFPDHWTISTAKKVMEAVHEAAAAARTADQLQTRLTEVRQSLETFANDVQKMCEPADAGLKDMPPIAAVHHAIERVDEAKRIVQERRSREQAIARLRALQDQQQQQLSQVESQVVQLWKLARVDSDEALRELVELQKQLITWRQEAHALAMEISAHRGNEDEHQFSAELEHADPDLLESELRDVDRAVQDADAAFEKRHQQLGAVQADLEKFDTQARSVEIAADLESHRSELAQAVDRWAPIVIAERLLEQNMDRFEQRFQPALLVEAQQFLARMTGGRYTHVRRRTGADGVPEVLDAQEDIWKGPEQLSRGTREQLYLAIRLAYVLHHCSNSESLPLVMDDVLVNFDATRAAQTLEVLREVAESVQILFLTCHASTLNLIREVAPHVAPLQLHTSATATPTSSVS